jgi:tetratricopeptide (TPR) repeat protein
MATNNITPKAFDLYLEGQRLFSIIERKRLEEAAEKFRQATAEAPNFARAWGHLAYCLAQIVVGGHAPQKSEADSLLGQAEGYARKAVKLDPYDYANRWDLAFALLNQGGRAKEAFDEYESALDLFDRRTDMLERRNDLLVEMAEAHVYDGNTKRAFELLDRAVKIPDWYRWIRAWACFNARDYQGTIDQINGMHKHFGETGYVPDIQLLLAAAYAHQGDAKQAEVALDRLKKGRPEWTLDRELARNPFTNDADRQHWEDGMKRAGFA